MKKLLLGAVLVWGSAAQAGDSPFDPALQAAISRNQAAIQRCMALDDDAAAITCIKGLGPARNEADTAMVIGIEQMLAGLRK